MCYALNLSNFHASNPLIHGVQSVISDAYLNLWARPIPTGATAKFAHQSWWWRLPRLCCLGQFYLLPPLVSHDEFYIFFPTKNSSRVHTLHLLIRCNVTLTVFTNIFKRQTKKCSMQIYARVDLQRGPRNPPQLFGIIFFNVCVGPFCECERARELLFHFFCVQKELAHTCTLERISKISCPSAVKRHY